MSHHDYIYDCECYPNFFSCSVKSSMVGERWLFEISERVNHSRELIGFLNSLRNSGVRMVGFNNLGYDYPLLHLIYTNGYADAPMIYAKSQQIIGSDNAWEHLVWESDHIVPQVDLYKIHHFDNQARRTSLKMVEFNQRSATIEDLPYPPGTVLTPEQMNVTIGYNNHDVDETEKFYVKSRDAIRFREELSERYGRNFINHNDTKIGKDFFIMRLEAAGVQCYERGVTGRQPRQTRRPEIHLRDAVFPYVQFMRPEFQRILSWFKSQTITETKGVFKDVSVTVDGFQFDFGTGGIHGSVESRLVTGDDEWALIDLDVASYYPNLAIANRVYPEHLSPVFCDIYKDVYEQRKQYPKGTPDNAVFKLALNGVYGDSNSQYSPFYDPLYTMKITINGQLLLCILAEHLMGIPTLQMIQINTDGLTIRVHRNHLAEVTFIRQWWESFTLLTLEQVEYSRMFIRDVNNYLAEYREDGKLKRKGAYEYKREWHQNHSSLVIPKAVEAALVHGVDVEQFIRNHDDLMDFMLRTKVPRTSRLILDVNGTEHQLQNITRYYVSKGGGALFKMMPPLARKPDVWRKIGVTVGWTVTPCNKMVDALNPIDYDYYVSEARKLTEIFR